MNGKKVALKISYCEPDPELEWKRKFIEDEVDIHKALSHHYVLKTVDSFKVEDLTILVTELCENGVRLILSYMQYKLQLFPHINRLTIWKIGPRYAYR